MPATNERTSTMLRDATTRAQKRRLREYRYSLPLRPKAMSILASEPSDRSERPLPTNSA